MTIKWQNAHRNFNNFKSKHSNWLETDFDFLDTGGDIVLPPESSKSGRPRLFYEKKITSIEKQRSSSLVKRDPTAMTLD